MKKFARKIIIGILLIFILDFGIGKLMQHYYFKQSSGFQYRTTEAIKNTESQILVFGSSRASHHYEPSSFKSKFNKTFYNTGRDGNFIFYQTAILQAILKRYSPEIIIYDVAGSFEYNESDYDRLSSLLPYYHLDKDIAKMVNLRSPFESIKTFSKIYPYNSLLLNIILGNMHFNRTKNSDLEGYVPLKDIWNDEIQSINRPHHYKIDSVKLKQFIQFVDLSTSKNIPIYVIYSPLFFEYDKDYTIEICKRICAQNNIPFFDYSKNNVFLKDHSLFSDPEHLNEKGARVFSDMVATKIKEDKNLDFKKLD